VKYLTKKSVLQWGCLLLGMLLVLPPTVALAGLPQGSQSLVRFRRAYLLSNVTFPAAVGFYPQLEDDQAVATAKNSVVKNPTLKPVRNPVSTTGVFATPVTNPHKPVIHTADGVLVPSDTIPPPPDETAFKQRVKHGIVNILNVMEIGNASIAKRLELSPLDSQKNGFIQSVDNGEDYLYLPAIGIPLPIRLQSKTTFVH
jgi:hypothetical protein